MRPRDADAAGPPRGRELSDRHDDGYPVAANIQAPSDAELIDILQRALRGDPYPVSGRRAVPEPAPARQPPLAERIRDILRSDLPAEEGGAAAFAPAIPAPPRSALPGPAIGEAAMQGSRTIRQAISRPDIAAPAMSRPALSGPAVPMPLPVSTPEPRILTAPEPEPFLDGPQPSMPVLDVVDAVSDHPPISGIVELEPAVATDRRRGLGWMSIAFVAAAAIAGAALPGLMAGPPRYAAESRLQLQAEAIAQPGFLDAAVKRIGSPHLLSQIVARLKLDRDPEFTGGPTGPLGIALELLSGSDASADAPSRAQAALRDAISISANPPALLSLSVITGDAGKSARIANMLADAAVYDAVIAQGTDLPGQTAALDVARKAYDQATAALAAFSAENGEDKIKAAIDLQQQKQQLAQQAEDAGKAVVDARIRQTAAKSARLSDVLEGSLSPDLHSSPALEGLRDRYAAARTALSQLSVQLGPRHPRLLAQQATVDGLRANIQTELQRLAASSDADLKTALAEQKAASDRLAALNGRTAGIDMARFGQLQDAAEAARGHYETMLQGSGSAKSPAAATVPLSIVAPAVAASAPLDDDPTAAEAAGFLLGLGIALCLVFLRTWLADALAGEGGADGAAPAVEAAHHHVEPVMEVGRLPISPPPQRFDAAIPVANDRPAAADLPSSDEVRSEDIVALQRHLASLRAKVETYAQYRQRHARRG